jgi:hypothetical protein
LQRATEVHLVIHDAIQEVDRALTEHMTKPENHDAIQSAIDYLTDALLSQRTSVVAEPSISLFRSNTAPGPTGGDPPR